MPRDEDRANILAGRAGLVFAYVCFVVSIGTMAAAISLLPLDFKVKLFLGAATLLLASMFAFLAYAALVTMRAAPRPSKDKSSKTHDEPG